MSYFEQRERALLGDAYDVLYTAKQGVCRGLTVNTLRMPPKQLHTAIASLSPSPFCENAFAITDDTFRAGQHPYHHAGAYYVQEPSAAAPAALLQVQKGDKVLDVCAAPGGKSAQLAAALGGEGLLVANEFVAARAAILKSNLERIGACNAVILNTDTAHLAKAFPLYFDKILVDAPCSGEGMFRKEPQAVAQHGEALVHSCAALGAEILDNAAACLAPGGTMVYSTCTFSAQENEAQIGAFLRRHTDFYIVPCAVDFGTNGEHARSAPYDYSCEFARRIYPCHGGEGHFMAKLCRKTDDDANTTSAPCTVKAARRAQRAGQSAQNSKPEPYAKAFLAQYFPKLTACTLLQHNASIYLLPDTPLPDFANLHLLCAGVLAGSLVKNRFEPSHALFMAYGALCENREMLTLHDTRTLAWLRGEEIDALTAKNGYAAVLVDGMPIGFGKISGGKVKNHYPKGLRNLK